MISFVAIALTYIVIACVPALPPIEATMGIKTAIAIICCNCSEYISITRDANMAVNKFNPNQINLEVADVKAPL